MKFRPKKEALQKIRPFLSGPTHRRPALAMQHRLEGAPGSAGWAACAKRRLLDSPKLSFLFRFFFSLPWLGLLFPRYSVVFEQRIPSHLCLLRILLQVRSLSGPSASGRRECWICARSRCTLESRSQVSRSSLEWVLSACGVYGE